jgi:hypothetical protein
MLAWMWTSDPQRDRCLLGWVPWQAIYMESIFEEVMKLDRIKVRMLTVFEAWETLGCRTRFGKRTISYAIYAELKQVEVRH